MEAPLPKPEHLRDVPTSTGAWLAQRPTAIAALVLGILTFGACAIATSPMWASPDWRIAVPGFALTALTAVASFVRRERAWGLAVTGLGLAAASLVLGWFFLIAIILGVTALLIVILHTVM